MANIGGNACETQAWKRKARRINFDEPDVEEEEDLNLQYGEFEDPFSQYESSSFILDEFYINRRLKAAELAFTKRSILKCP